jgi:hypothetical protein
VKLTFVIVVITLVGEPTQFQNSGKAFPSRHSLKPVDVRIGNEIKGKS